MTRRSILTVAVAVLGLALSAGLAWSASQLAGLRIGLASEPLSVVQGLAPRQLAAASPQPSHNDHGKVRSKPPGKPRRTTTRNPIFTTSTATAMPVTPAAPAMTAAPSSTASPPPVTRTSAPPPSSSSGSLSSSGASPRRDDHHPDD